MRAGATRSTVTGMTRLSSPHTWVMPTFSPTIAFVAICVLCRCRRGPQGGIALVVVHEDAPHGSRAERRDQLSREVPARDGHTRTFGWRTRSDACMRPGLTHGLVMLPVAQVGRNAGHRRTDCRAERAGP